jgi:aspartyl/asparaginyl beta-hydroxylase (cupin superfamily)
MKQARKFARKAVLAVLALAALLYTVPLLTAFYLCTGLIDVLRNTRRDAMVFERYFLGNGIPTWLLSPFNLLIDLFSYRNPGIYRLEDLPPAWRSEVETVLDTFKARKAEIIGDVDRVFEAGRRGMYVFKWYGKENDHSIGEFKRPFTYVRTIAVSVFSGREATSFHYGPLRLTLRVLYNLSPVRSDAIFIECGNRRHYWHDDPLFIFDDTLIHRSVNEYDARRYCVFMDIIRPTPFPRLLSALVAGVAVAAEKINSIFYKHWKMLRPAAKPPLEPAEAGKR